MYRLPARTDALGLKHRQRKNSPVIPVYLAAYFFFIAQAFCCQGELKRLGERVGAHHAANSNSVLRSVGCLSVRRRDGVVQLPPPR